MTRDTTEEEVVAAGGDGNGVVAGGVRGDWGGGIAGLVLWVGDLHHIVKLRIVAENWFTILTNFVRLMSAEISS